MWCNERNSPLDQMMQGQAPGDFSEASRNEAIARGIDVEACRRACIAMYDFMQDARAGKEFDDSAFVTFLRVLMQHPEVLIWERFWLERNKDLDRELYGLVKWCKPNLPFGLNVWNRNHFNIFRRAQWPWEEQTMYADWVKPITYQQDVYKRQAVEHDSIVPELGFMVEVGVCPDNLDALRAITARAAVLNGMGDRLGTLEVGKLADMIVVNGKPDLDLNALEKVEMTFIDGKRMH